MKELPRRKQNRLEGYDYSGNDAYFVTICAKDRAELFSKITVGADIIRPQPTESGGAKRTINTAPNVKLPPPPLLSPRIQRKFFQEYPHPAVSYPAP